MLTTSQARPPMHTADTIAAATMPLVVFLYFTCFVVLVVVVDGADVTGGDRVEEEPELVAAAVVDAMLVCGVETSEAVDVSPE